MTWCLVQGWVYWSYNPPIRQCVLTYISSIRKYICIFKYVVTWHYNKWCFLYILPTVGWFDSSDFHSKEISINATETLTRCCCWSQGDVTLPFDKVVCEETYFHGKQFLGERDSKRPEKDVNVDSKRPENDFVKKTWLKSWFGGQSTPTLTIYIRPP